MTQPQYSQEDFSPGATPSVAEYLNPAGLAPTGDATGAVATAIARRQSLEAAMAAVPNMCNPGIHAGPIGVDAGGVDADS